MSKYDWTNVPEIDNWIATDACGNAFGWRTKPYIEDGELEWNTCESYIGNHFISAKNNPFKGDWRDSLEERPNEHV